MNQTRRAFTDLQPLRRADLPRDTVALARFLIGTLLVRERGGHVLSARIVETEAYMPDDASSHAYRGLTERNRSMFGERGHAYVYFIYGSWFCLNVSAERPNVGAAVLVRAAEAIAGIETMQQLRGGVAERDLLRGPGRLCAALDVDRALDGIDLCRPGPLIVASGRRRAPIGESVRIGLTREAHRVLRFYERGSPHVSGPARINR